jgi:hypothetical protein
VKTTLDGVDQRDYLEGKSQKSALALFRQGSLGGPIQELEDVLRDGIRCTDWLRDGCNSESLDVGGQLQA